MTTATDLKETQRAARRQEIVDRKIAETLDRATEPTDLRALVEAHSRDIDRLCTAVTMLLGTDPREAF